MKEDVVEDGRVYHFGASRLVIRFGDITSSTAQVLVSSDDSYLTMGGGVSAALLRAGGQVIALDATKKVPADLGDVVVTTVGSLPAQYIFHAVTLDLDADEKSDTKVFGQVMRRSLQLLDALRLRSIAFPSRGS